MLAAQAWTFFQSNAMPAAVMAEMVKNDRLEKRLENISPPIFEYLICLLCTGLDGVPLQFVHVHVHVNIHVHGLISSNKCHYNGFRINLSYLI